MNALVGMALGAVVGVGVLCVIAGVVGTSTPSPARLPSVMQGVDRLPLRAGLAVGGAVVAFVATGWLVGALAAGAAAALGPTVVGARGRRQAAIARTEAIAAWAEMLRDTMAGASGLQEAIVTTARVAPPPIRAEVRALAVRIEREPFVPSVRRLAAELRDPVGDVVVAALVLAAERQSGSLGEVLGAAAASARASANMRLRVEAGRARTYTSTRMIVATTAVFAVGLIAFNRRYLEPFDTAVGQLVLAVIVSLFGVGLWSLAKLAEGEPPQRLFARVAGEPQ